MALFEELVGAVKLRREPIDVPEWAGILGTRKLWMQQMGLEERDAWELDSLKETDDGYDTDPRNARAKLLYRCIVDDEGNKVFPTAATLTGLSPVIGIPLYEQARRLNWLQREQVEGLAKN